MKNHKKIMGNKYETMDGAFTQYGKRNRNGDGWHPKKARRLQAKRLRQAEKNDKESLTKDPTTERGKNGNRTGNDR